MLQRAFKKINHFLQDNRDYDSILSSIAEQYKLPLAFVRMDCLWCRVKYGAPVSQYVGFEMYRMNARERNTYITDGRTQFLKKKLNTAPTEEIRCINNKTEFNKKFYKFIKRQWVYAPDTENEELCSFLESNSEVIVKPAASMKGQGVRRLATKEILDNFEDYAEEFKRDGCMVETIIKQHPALSSVNPSSVNTIRVATVRGRNGEVCILGASLRGGGSGAVIDNLHAGGVQYPIDVETGIIIRGGVQFDGKKNVLFHPGSGTKMIGFQIPNWENVIASVKEAATITGSIRYLGWDVAVTEDGCEIIEANYSQGCNGMQQDGNGKYSLLKRYM